MMMSRTPATERTLWRVGWLMFALACLWLALGAWKCPGPPPGPGPVCTSPSDLCCWLLVNGTWVKTPCTEPTPEPSPSPSPSPTPTPSPEPSPTASPTPAPTPTPLPTPTPGPSPTPTPNPSPTPASCPVMVCIHAQVHLAAGPGGLLPGPTACQGCRVVIDSTPLFEVCLARGRCNSEFDLYCKGRLCEDARGYAWRQTGGPNTLWRIQEPGPDRGYQIVVDTPVSGIYRFEVCAAGPLDTEGYPVQVGQECNPITFEVP